MSIGPQKAAIAAAVDAVDGVKAFSKRPSVLTPGVAYVRWRGWERADGGAYASTWSVVVVLPQGSEEAADEWIYEHADALEDALRPVMYVESFQPASLPTESNPRGLFALQINGRSE